MQTFRASLLLIVLPFSVSGVYLCFTPHSVEIHCSSDEVILVDRITSLTATDECSPLASAAPAEDECANDVLRRMRQECGGWRNCSSRSMPSCAEKFAVEWRCESDARADWAQLQDGLMRLDVKEVGERGTLSSLQSRDDRNNGTGTPRLPWLLVAAPGQYFNISIWDFTDTRKEPPTSCPAYVVVRERFPAVLQTLCGGKGNRNLYQSRSHQLEVSLLGLLPARDERRFVVQWKVYGCHKLKIDSPNVWVTYKKSHQIARVMCASSVVELNCIAGNWEGTMPNCSGLAYSGISFNLKNSSGMKVAMISLTVILSVILILVAVFTISEKYKEVKTKKIIKEKYIRDTKSKIITTPQKLFMT